MTNAITAITSVIVSTVLYRTKMKRYVSPFENPANIFDMLVVISPTLLNEQQGHLTLSVWCPL